MGASLLVLAAVVVVTPVGAALSDIEFSAQGPEAIVPSDPAVSEGPVDQVTPTPQLDEADRARALRLIADDARAQQILGERGYGVAEIGPWTESDAGGERLVGATLLLSFRAPQSFRLMDWPQIGYSSVTGAGRYAEKLVKLAATGVTELLVDVDFSKARVVNIGPRGDHARIIPAVGSRGTVPPLEEGY